MANPTLEVSNFGPISCGQVELRPLTVFAGPSNTGKSWLATLIYALYQNDEDAFQMVVGAHEDFWDFEENKPLLPSRPDAWIEGIEKGQPINLTAAEKHIVDKKRREHLERLGRELRRCYGVMDLSALVREGCTAASINLGFKNHSVPDQLPQKLLVDSEVSYAEEPLPWLDVGADQIEFLKDVQNALTDPAIYSDKIGFSEGVRSLDGPTPYFIARVVRVIRSLTHLISDNVMLSPKAWYLPADRGGIMHAHAALVSNLIQGASQNQSEAASLTGVVADFLSRLVRLAQAGKLDDMVVDESADHLERNVMGGHVSVESGVVSYPRFSFQPDGWERTLPLLNVSSMVTELAPVALYLRNYVARGELLILEEPEAHLHPAKQVEFVREISGWVKAGIRVLLTTHSEWVLDEVSNLVAESRAGKESGVKQEDVGVWLFKSEGKDGSTVDEVPWAPDEGGFEVDYFNVAARQHNNWANNIEGNE